MMASSAQVVRDDQASVGDEIGLEDIRIIEDRSYKVIERLRETVFAPDKTKVLSLRFSVSEAARLVGRTPTAIRDAEKAGRLPPPTKNARGRRAGYTLPEINVMRREFGTLPYRDASTDDPVVLGVQNFKGGVGKSTVAVHLAHYLALQGYRVCLIDLRSPGQHHQPHGGSILISICEPSTPWICTCARDRDNLAYAIRDTYFDQIKLIPANLSLYSVEYDLAARLPGNPLLLDRLRSGIAAAQDEFDVVIIDPPPALGMISLSVIRAANALIVPVRPATIDFGSTAHFFTMLGEALETLEKHGMPASYKFIKVLGNDMDEGKSAHTEITKMMQKVYGPLMLPNGHARFGRDRQCRRQPDECL